MLCAAHRRLLRQIVVQQARHGGQQGCPLRRFGFQLAQQAFGAHLFVQPVLQKGLGGLPQIHLGIQLARQAFHIQQGFLQQHQLRLNFDLKAARDLEQAHQHHAQRDFAQGFIKIRFAHAAYRTF